eukprot:842329-Pyramimonas_sp.AAC.1
MLHPSLTRGGSGGRTVLPTPAPSYSAAGSFCGGVQGWDPRALVSRSGAADGGTGVICMIDPAPFLCSLYWPRES